MAKKKKIEVVENMTTFQFLQSLPDKATISVMQIKTTSGHATGLSCNGKVFLLPSTDPEVKNH